MNNKQIDFKPATHELSNVMFEVEQLPVVAKLNIFLSDDREINIPDYKALYNKRDRQLLSVVTNNYHLVSNKQAYEIGEKVFFKLFPAIDPKDLIPFKVIATKKLTSCHIDLIHKELNLNKWKQDAWLPFLRISNSYNRTIALSFEIGFVRKLCSNGFIFDKESIKVKYAHTKGTIPFDISVDASKLKKYEIDFVEHLNNLSRFYVDPEHVFPLVLSALNLRFNFNHSNQQQLQKEKERYLRTKMIIADLTDAYFNELKPTAYAVLNIITDFVSHQDKYKAIPLFTSHVNGYYSKPGNWIQNFTQAIQTPRFNMVDYLGEFNTYMN